MYFFLNLKQVDHYTMLIRKPWGFFKCFWHRLSFIFVYRYIHMTVLRIALLSKPLNNFQELLYSHLSDSKGGGMTSPYTYLTFEYEFHTWKKNCHSEYCFKYLVFWLDRIFSIWLSRFYAILTRQGHRASGFWCRLEWVLTVV
jgi:hypothetical protein